MPCPIKHKSLYLIGAGIHPALKYDFGNSPGMSGLQNTRNNLYPLNPEGSARCVCQKRRDSEIPL